MNKFKIGIDARMWSHPGIGRYIRELSRELVAGARGVEFSFIGNPKPIQDFFSVAEYPGPAPSYIEAHSKVYSLSEQWEISKKASGLDLLHVPHFNIPVLSRKKLVVTVHDLIYLHEPDASRSRFGGAYTAWLLKVIEKKASAVITVSEYTKKDLLNYFPGLPADRVFVTYEAPSPLFKKIENSAVLQTVSGRYGLSKPFVLFVGTLKHHKNLSTLIHAMKLLKEKEGVSHELVVVGRKDERQKELLSLIRENSFVRYLGELPDPELVALYNLADAFVLPSFYEGFGLPAIEAMACGTPVIASNRSSLPEVVGSAGLSFDPNQVDALVELLYNVLMDEELRKKLSNMGLEQVGRFSWKKTAEKTLKVYEQAMS